MFAFNLVSIFIIKYFKGTLFDEVFTNIHEIVSSNPRGVILITDLF